MNKMSLYVLTELNLNGYAPDWTFYLGMIATILAILTIVIKNPVHSVLYLIGLFIVIALYLIVSGMPFLGISYLLVYVGAISILFLFILMLINIRISELLTEGRNSAILAVMVVLAFGFAFNNKLPVGVTVYEFIFDSINTISVKGTDLLAYEPSKQPSVAHSVLGKNWDGYLIEVTHISSVGSILYNVVFMHIMVIGVILLLAMVGAILITIRPEEKSQQADKSFQPNYMEKSPLYSKGD